MDKLKIFSQKVLPLVYDQSLSYYEVLAKVVAKVNEIIKYVTDNVIRIASIAENAVTTANNAEDIALGMESRIAQNEHDIDALEIRKQDVLTFDNTPTDGSTNPVTSDGIYEALQLKQDELTFDNTPTDGSTNPVTSDGIYEALQLKQDELTFDEYPTEESTNPVESGGIWSFFNDFYEFIYDILPRDSKSGSIVEFDNALGFNADDVFVDDIEPVQNLNGYTKPWVGGGGKNKLNANRSDYSTNGIDFVINKDANGNVISISASGTATSSATLQLTNCYLTAGTYILSGCPADGDGSSKWRIRLGNASDSFIGNDTGNGFTFTLSADTFVTVKLNVEILNTPIDLTFYPMICISTAVDPLVFEPYTNICPITGHTGITVNNSINDDLSNPATYTINFGRTAYECSVDVTSGNLVITKAVYSFDGNENISMTTQGGYNRFNFYSSPITFASDPTAASELCSHYAINTSVLGGNTVDQAIYTKNNAIMWRDDNITSKDDMIVYLKQQYNNGTPLQICAPLAVSIGVGIDPTSVMIYGGTNHLWASTGNIYVEYVAQIASVESGV